MFLRSAVLWMSRGAGDLSVLPRVELASVRRHTLVQLVVPADPHVEEQPLVEEAAVQLGVDVE
jgi:hypothetical protein